MHQKLNFKHSSWKDSI